MEEPRYLQADLAFRGGGHTVRLRLAPAALGVEVEAHGTVDQWRGEFDAAFIEELTHKTGNFKQFGVFCSMLESALTQSSESVSLELLTYADLEALRSRKVGAMPRPPPSTASPLNAKRYLILVYSVEFDRIHYPLPLPYAGRPDPAALHRLVRELREELARLRARRRDDGRDAEIRHLQDGLRRALEKRAAEATALRRMKDELAREKARHQREHRQLAAELAEVKASERRLQQRVKSLTAELASCKRGSHRTPVGTASRPQERRSASRESRRGGQGRPPSRSPSPAGSRPPRFDPTAFVRARQRRQEAGLKNQRHGAAFGSASPARSRGRSSSAESFRSRRSAVSSSSEADERSKPLPPRGRRETRAQRALSTLSWNSPGVAPRPAAGRKVPMGSVASERPGKENCSEEPSAELAEIDARLQALQEYMESLDTRL
ncbi:centrosomal protein CCDC61 isoform X1 [Rissa tridactyla]|uniref:centrosomal protein CCDC61 isoform X1 n=1 Tax=Rissa tridactyla TaxID=75485 RepID=UPI0023BB181E|nr:centrosomal protein CCDC61 isoform X1 [Rissa tridactyla]